MTCFTALGGAPLPRGGRRDACPMPRIALRAAPNDRQCADHCRHRSFGWRGDTGRSEDGLGAGRLWHERDHRRGSPKHMRHAR